MQVSAESPASKALRFWNNLMLFIDDGRIRTNSNAVERPIRPVAFKRKKALFVGYDTGAQNWAMLASLIKTCKYNKIEPHSYLNSTLTATANGHKRTDIQQLLHWNYAGQVESEPHLRYRSGNRVLHAKPLSCSSRG